MMPEKFVTTRSVWSAAAAGNSGFDRLSAGYEADVAVIGAGITGISTAYNLSRKGLKVIVIDSAGTGSGTTGYSTGNLYIPTGQFHTILSKHGRRVLTTVAGARADAIAFIEDRINEFGIECGFRRVPWMYFTTFNPDMKEIENERDAIRAAGVEALHTVPERFPFPAKAMARVDSQAQFNPLQYVTKLAAAISNDNCRIFERTKALDIKDGDPCIVETTGGTIRAGSVVQATHTPKGIYAVHAMMEVYRESAVAAKLSGEYPAEGIYWFRQGKEKYSIRTYSTGSETYLIVIDDSGKTGHKRTDLSFSKIENFLRAEFNVSEISYRWAAQNYSPADDLPYIGLSPLQKNVYIATGFSADGLVYGTAAAKIISDLITGTENQWRDVFDASRFTPVASAKKAARENADIIAHLVKEYIIKGEEKEFSDIRNGEGKIVEYNKEKAAAARDDEGNLSVVSAKCPHMGCIVQWNEAEKTWDCPCHGSRFSTDGELIEGPAFNGLTLYRRAH